MNSIKINQSELIRKVTEKLNSNSTHDTDMKTIAQFIHAMEEIIIEYLNTAYEGTNIVVIPMKGLQLSSKCLPEIEKVNNLTGEPIIRKAKLKYTAAFTPYFKENALKNVPQKG